MGSANLCRIRKVATASATWKRGDISGPVKVGAGAQHWEPCGLLLEGSVEAHWCPHESYYVGSTVGGLRAKGPGPGTPCKGLQRAEEEQGKQEELQREASFLETAYTQHG